MKSEQLQIRLTSAQKAKLRRLARTSGLSLSTYVVERVIPRAGTRFDAVLEDLRAPEGRRYALAELNDLLVDLDPSDFSESLAGADLEGLSEEIRNRVAAMVEEAAAAKGTPAPAWTREVAPLDAPRFATDLPGLRIHLLRASPVAFRKRNLFVDAAVGDRV